ncbi:hypothetical protein C8F04DRAFT_1189216 [Mycena alexandri]|uniref:Uncharacterized protein n=1 Tax=Mycena alexandri TaxID=1745969 RepID=A0AAD6SKK1_9AGAR|nr:hypothetical protein C8F04DRAFT_1189216 [Mycena alexandri]
MGKFVPTAKASISSVCGRRELGRACREYPGGVIHHGQSGNSASAAKAKGQLDGYRKESLENLPKLDPEMVKIREYQVKRKTDFASSLDDSRKWRKITEDPWARMGPWIRCKGKVFIVSAGVPRADFARICALKSDSEQLRAIYTRRRSKVTPQPQVLDTSSGALLRATERISRPPTASIQLVLTRWAPSHERLTPGEVAPVRNLRRHSVIQQSHQSVAVRDLRPRWSDIVLLGPGGGR